MRKRIMRLAAAGAIAGSTLAPTTGYATPKENEWWCENGVCVEMTFGEEGPGPTGYCSDCWFGSHFWAPSDGIYIDNTSNENALWHSCEENVPDCVTLGAGCPNDHPSEIYTDIHVYYCGT
jgi:hypothetical protein